MSEPPSRPPGRGRLTFSLMALLMVMGMCSILSALLAGLMNAKGGDQYGYVLATIAAPGVVMMILSFWLYLRELMRRGRK